MPKPLIILENHSSTAAKTFIVGNVTNLKNLGYKKVLLEVTKEHNPASYKSQLRDCIQAGQMNPLSPAAKMMVHAKPMLEVLETLDKHQIPYEFIDPQSEKDTQQLLMETMQKYSSGFYKSEQEMKEQLEAHNVANAKIRDKSMSSTIIQQAENNDGGVIFCGGFMHKDLVAHLRADSPEYRFAIFDNSYESYPRWDSQNNLHQIWSNLSNDSFRNQFYGAEVNFFNLASNPSFDTIADACRLTAFCEEPTVGSYLRESTNQVYSYEFDKNYVLTAKTKVANEVAEQVVSKIEKSFPGLRFFAEKGLARTSISIPGINLPENHDVLAEGFVRAGVMRL